MREVRASPEAAERNEPAAGDAPEGEQPREAEPPPEGAFVDLLRSVGTDLAVSSTHRSSSLGAASLVDGDVETAWNSRSGDLAGAWIEVRLPPTATITSIALTVGFTRRAGDRDLFTMNHRVTRVRVLRDGVELSSHRLDPESRELQQVPVEGGGGVYRVEVLETVPGTRRDWREVCLSELRVFGRDPGARAGQRFPRTAVRRLPDPRREPGSYPRAEVHRALRREASWLGAAWFELEELVSYHSGNYDPFASPSDQASATQARRTILLRVAELVDLVDDVRPDRLRLAATTSVNWASHTERHAARLVDAAEIAGALEAVTSWLGDDEARCRWARTHLRIRLYRLGAQVVHQRTVLETLLSQAGENGGLGFIDAEMEDFAGVEARRMAALHGALERAAALLNGPTSLAESWDRDPRGTAATLRRVVIPENARARAELDVVRAELAAHSSCRWDAAP